MAASIVAKSTMSVLSLLFLMALGAMAGTVAPSNSTLPTTESGALNALKLSGGALVDVKTYVIAPLTVAVGRGGNAATASVITFSGNAVLTDYSSTGNLTANDIAIISCDPNGSNIDASTVVGNAGALFPKAIVLYTLIGQACDLTVPYTYQSIFTMTSQRDSNSLVSTIHLASTTNSMTVAIGPSSPGSPGTSVGSTTANEGGPAPTTAVAMSILYSITGIITLLFLIIIATGAIRAHRHPERYGPRNGFPGRPRQSRAKGLARAMLETLPIVKFGDPEPVKPNQDVELEDGHAHNRDASVTSGITTNEARPKISPTAADVASGMGAAQAESVKSGDENAGKEGELGCSICTEDFTTGEDVRVLPCNHKYHPACIDPWLLNVSGTCPLCRHDLRPVISNTENTEGTGTDGDELPPPLSINDGAEGHETDRASADDAPHRRRMSRFVDLRRLRNAPPDERIAALRTLREESQREAAPVENTEERSRRARLTGRLRDTFRIRTRTENSTSDPSSS